MRPISQVKRKSAVEARRGRESALLGNGDCELLDTAVEGGASRGQTLDPAKRLTRTLFSQAAMENRPCRPGGPSTASAPPRQPLPSPASQLHPQTSETASNRYHPASGAPLHRVPWRYPGGF